MGILKDADLPPSANSGQKLSNALRKLDSGKALLINGAAKLSNALRKLDSGKALLINGPQQWLFWVGVG